MSIEDTTDVAVDTATQPTSYIDSEGNFTEGWRDAYVPEEYRNEAIFDRVKNVQGMAKSLANAEKIIGKNKVVIPNENSSQEEWDAWNRAHGVPESPEDYKFNLPEGVEADPDFQAAAAQIFKEAGLNQKQADALVQWYEGQRAEAMKMQGMQAEQTAQQLHDELLTEWGNAFEQKKHLGNVALTEAAGGDVELQQRISEKFGNDPDFIRAMANLGGKFAESGAAPTTVKPAMTPDQLQSEISELMSSAAYMDKRHANHQTVMKQVQNLFRQKHNS